MSSLKRVTSAPGLVVALWLVEIGIAAFVGYSARQAVAAALGGYSVLGDGHLLFAIADLLIDHPAVASQIVSSAIGSAVLGVVLWTILAGGIVSRLAGVVGWERLTAASARWLPAIVVTSLWHLLLRGILVAAVMLGTAALPRMVTAPILALVVLVCTCALDISRVHVVQHGARGFHIRTAWMGFVQAVRHPALLGKSVALSLCQWACVVAIFAVAGFGLGTVGTLLLARPLALLSLLFGLWRIAVVVEAGPLTRR
jgi:hypothetical protein